MLYIAVHFVCPYALKSICIHLPMEVQCTCTCTYRCSWVSLHSTICHSQNMTQKHSDLSQVYICTFCSSRLQGEKKVYELIKRIQVYMEPRLRDSHPDILCSIYIRRIEHLYYKVHVAYTCTVIMSNVHACTCTLYMHVHTWHKYMYTQHPYFGMYACGLEDLP